MSSHFSRIHNTCLKLFTGVVIIFIFFVREVFHNVIKFSQKYFGVVHHVMLSFDNEQ